MNKCILRGCCVRVACRVVSVCAYMHVSGFIQQVIGMRRRAKKERTLGQECCTLPAAAAAARPLATAKPPGPQPRMTTDFTITYTTLSESCNS